MSLVITTGSSSSIVTTKRHHHHHLFRRVNHRHPFLSLQTLLFLSLSRTSSSSSSSSSSTSTFLNSSQLYPSNNHSSSNSLTRYADIASRLVENGRFEEFKLIVESVVSCAGCENSGFGELLNSKLLVSGIVKGIQEGRITGVVGLFDCFSELGFDVLRVFDGSAMELLKRECCSLVFNAHLEDAVVLMEVLAGLKFSVKDLVTPGDFIRMLVSKRSPYLAVRYACLLPHSEVVYCTLIRDFGKGADLPSAVKVFDASKQKLAGHNMYLYRTMIDVCGLCGDSFMSRLIYEDLHNQKVTPNIFVFNSLMNVNSHDLTYVMEVYKQMQDYGVAPDMTSYNILLKACCLSERVDLAQDIYAKVQHLESTGALKLDVFTYSTIIKVFADAKLWQMAMKIKEDMVSAGVTPNTVTWSSLISACANAGLVDQATELFEEMLLAGCEPNSLCFNTLLHACVEAGQYDRAFYLFNAWKSSSSSDKSSDNSSSDIAQCGTVKHRLSFIKSIPFEPTTETLNILLKACGTNLDHAKGLIEDMKEMNLSPDQISWSILIDICGASANVRGALQILKTMRETGMKPDVVAYTTAIKILKTMRETGMKPDVVAYTTAIKVCVDSKHMKTAFSLFVEMKRYHIKPNLVTYNTLLRAHSKYGSLLEIQQCLAIYQDMRKSGYKSNDYYVKLLIEEWCEGVLQNDNQGRDYKLRDRADIGDLRGLLLDRVATQLQKNTAESLAVDIQGLTKVEARLVVLAVLRMIKENYMSGRPLQDDLVVILGMSNVDAMSTIEDAITKLLTKELRLEVLSINQSVTLASKTKAAAGSNSQITPENSELLASVTAPIRRPALLQSLVVTKKSLNFWLRRKLDRAFRR